jgi:hypothetical protein
MYQISPEWRDQAQELASFWQAYMREDRKAI